jgi:nucleotide sugar dehydrogenase
MIIGIIGGDKVGLSFGLLCEKNGYNVIIHDDNEDYVYNLNQKICITNEPMIQSMLFDVKQFSATTNTLDVIINSDIIFTYVDTPINIDGDYDTRKIFELVTNFYSASSLDTPLYNKKFIVGSTTNVGDVSQIQERLNMFNVQVAYNPLQAPNGNIISGIENSDVILIGTEYQELTNELIKLYNKILKVPVNVYNMSIKSAELTKLSISSFVATKIAYANMIGDVMSKLGLQDEIGMVLSTIGGDSRIGKKSLKYGFGFGGPSLPNENRALGIFTKNLGIESNLPLFTDTLNKEHSSFLKNFFIQQNPNKEVPFVMEHMTYKKGTNILEESQQFQLCIDLLNEGYSLNVIEYDEISKKLNSLSESYNNRLRFFKVGSNPEGYKIRL